MSMNLSRRKRRSPSSVTQANEPTAPETALPAAHMVPVPMDVPVITRVPMASLVWSPTMQPMNCRPLRSSGESGERRMVTSP